jgi:hypothetical protein
MGYVSRRQSTAMKRSLNEYGFDSVIGNMVRASAFMGAVFAVMTTGAV